MSELMKNIPKNEVLELAALVDYRPGQVVSRTIAQRDGLSITLFALPAGEGLSTHSAPGDAMVQVLDGEAEITIGDEPFTVAAGQTIVMPADVPHGVETKTGFKMLLTVVKRAG